MDTNPIKYKDLILPDDSIETLIKQLDEANEAYNNIGNSIKAEAQRIASAMKTVSGATNEGREATRGYSESAQKLLKAERDLNFARSETARQIAELKAAQKDEQTITKLTIQLNRSAAGSYDALSAQYGLNKIRLNAMTQSERENTEIGKQLEAETAAIYEKMNNLQKATGKYTLQVGNYELATKNLKQELRQMQQELANMEAAGMRGSDAYNELAQRAGALQDNIQDARNEIKRYASDTRLLDDTVDIVTSASAAWQVYQGAVNAFGIESKEAMEAMAKLQGIIAITNGLQKLNAQFTNNASATYKVYHAVLRFIGLEEKANAVQTAAATAATEANTVAVEANATAQTANAIATNGATVATKAFRTALITTGIGAFVVAVGALIAYWDDIKEFFGGLSDAEKSAIQTQEILNDTVKDSQKAYGKAAAEMELYKEKVETFKGTQEQEKQLVDELNTKYGDALGKYKTLVEWKNRLGEAGEAYCQVLMKEAELTALLDAYQEAYLQKLEIRQKYERGDYSAWYRTKAGELKMMRDEQKVVDDRIKSIKDQMKKVVAEQKTLTSIFDININKTQDTKTKDTKDKSKEDAEKQQKELLDIERKTQELRNQLIEDGFSREVALINQKYAEEIADLQEKGEKEVALRAAIAEEIKALEAKRAMDLADIYTKYADKAIAEQKRIDDARKKANEQAYRTATDAVTKEAELQQLLISNMSVNSKKKEEMSLEAERERLRKIYMLNVAAGKDLTSLEMQTLSEQIKKADQAIKKAQKPQDVYDLLGLNLDDEQKEAISQSFDFAIEQLNSYLDSWVKAAEKKVELANQEVDSAKTALDAEREARANGYASNVEYAQKELDLAKQNQQKALREQERAQKAQQALATVQQATNLITASALIWSQLGFPWAIPAIAVMWGSFAAAKIKAQQVTQSGNEEYGEGTVELLQGGSHQSGNDVDLGRKKDGTRRRAEGGEFFAVINKRNSRKYRTIIPDVIRALNAGTFEDKYSMAYQGGQDVSITESPSVDLDSLRSDVTAIREQGERKTYTDSRGTHVVYRNLHRVILN